MLKQRKKRLLCGLSAFAVDIMASKYCDDTTINQGHKLLRNAE